MALVLNVFSTKHPTVNLEGTGIPVDYAVTEPADRLDPALRYWTLDETKTCASKAVNCHAADAVIGATASSSLIINLNSMLLYVTLVPCLRFVNIDKKFHVRF